MPDPNAAALAAQLIQPQAGAPAPAAPDVAAPAPDAAASAPVEKMPAGLLKIPAFGGLITGKPGAFSLPIKESKNRADLQDLAKYKDYLAKAGMAVYTALDGKTGVVFNKLYVHPEELKQADAAGQLLQIAPNFDSVNHELSKSGAAHPALNTGHTVPVGLKGPPIPQPPVAPTSAPTTPLPPPPASAQRKVMAARVNNLPQGSPTSGPLPGQGRLLNQILKPVI